MQLCGNTNPRKTSKLGTSDLQKYNWENPVCIVFSENSYHKNFHVYGNTYFHLSNNEYELTSSFRCDLSNQHIYSDFLQTLFSYHLQKSEQIVQIKHCIVQNYGRFGGSRLPNQPSQLICYVEQLIWQCNFLPKCF